MNPVSWLYYRLAPLVLRWMLRSRRYMTFCRWRARPVMVLPGRMMVARAEDAQAVLSRPNEFGMPYQAAMEELHTPFILGLSGSPAYDCQRTALVAALEPVDLVMLEQTTRQAARDVLDAEPGAVNLVEGYTDRVLRMTVGAVLWGGEQLTPDQMKAAREVARHIFVNPLNDPAIRRQAAGGAPRLRRAANDEVRLRAAMARDDDVLARLEAMADGHGRLGNAPVDDILGLMVAWITSVSRTMGFAFDELLRPDRARQLELAQIAARNGDSEIVLAVLFEALRFRPAMPALDRICTRETQLAGHLIKRGTHLWVALTGAMMDGSAYTDPDQFRDGGRDREYLHFGGLFRHCPGEAIARIQLAALSMELLRRPHVERRSKLTLDGPYPSQLLVGYGAIP